MSSTRLETRFDRMGFPRLRACWRRIKVPRTRRVFGLQIPVSDRTRVDPLLVASIAEDSARALFPCSNRAARVIELIRAFGTCKTNALRPREVGLPKLALLAGGKACGPHGHDDRKHDQPDQPFHRVFGESHKRHPDRPGQSGINARTELPTTASPSHPARRAAASRLRARCGGIRAGRSGRRAGSGRGDAAPAA